MMTAPRPPCLIFPSFEYIKADDPEFHWIRHHNKKKGSKEGGGGNRKTTTKRWYTCCWSKELIIFQLGTLDMNSPLAIFCGFENSILRTIVKFTGLDIIKPCTCCCQDDDDDSPLMFCCKQGKPFVVTDPNNTIPSLDSQNNYYKIPLKAFIGNYFFSYSLDMKKLRKHHMVIDKDSFERLYPTESINLFRHKIESFGTGIFACSSEGIYSTLMNASWNEIVNNYKVKVKKRDKKFSLIFETKSSIKYIRKGVSRWKNISETIQFDFYNEVHMDRIRNVIQYYEKKKLLMRRGALS